MALSREVTSRFDGKMCILTLQKQRAFATPILTLCFFWLPTLLLVSLCLAHSMRPTKSVNTKCSLQNIDYLDHNFVLSSDVGPVRSGRPETRTNDAKSDFAVLASSPRSRSVRTFLWSDSESVHHLGPIRYLMDL